MARRHVPGGHWRKPMRIVHFEKGGVPGIAADDGSGWHGLTERESGFPGTLPELIAQGADLLRTGRDELVGAISIFRAVVQPFADIQTTTDLAAQAAIALESTRYRETQMALAHANGVATMAQLTASIAHEVKQPLTAAAIYGNASLNWLARNTPEIEEAKKCAECLLKQIDRAVQIIELIHQLVKKTSPEKQRLDVNETIVEVIELVHSEILKNGVAVQTELADCLPPIQGDRVQLQQVILNLIVNAIQAMSNVSDGTREL